MSARIVMKVSGFTFLRNAEELGFPFIQSIQSVLPICDEFVIALGKSQDKTEALLLALNEPKIKIIHTEWNTNMRAKGYTYGQQKMIAQFACSGEWLFYLEGDEIVHEKDLEHISSMMKQYKDDSNVEALVFNYLHFYGNTNTYLESPAWYKQAPRIIKASIRSYAPDGLYWLVLDEKKSNRKARYPKAKILDAYMYHYGWVRPESAMIKKLDQVAGCWGDDKGSDPKYKDIDSSILRVFQGEHPGIVSGFFPESEGVYQGDPDYQLSKRDKRQHLKMKLEKTLNKDLSRKHFIRI
ncbi:glycosyltransferase [Francisellaceae bacterium]|nr:glycosyltransferase [Francisellaceae bacterium]